MQHTATDGELTNICTEAASIYPMGYGVLRIAEDHKSVEYTKAEFSINQKETEEPLVHTIHGMVLNSLQQTNAPPEEYASMIAY